MYVKKLIELLDQCDLRTKIIAYVKDQSANLNAMTIALKSIMNCEVFGMEGSFQGTCFGHVYFLKHVNMGQQNNFLNQNLKHISIKSTQYNYKRA